MEMPDFLVLYVLRSRASVRSFVLCPVTVHYGELYNFGASQGVY